MDKLFGLLSLRGKIICILITVLVGLIFISLMSSIEIKNTMLKEKKLKLRHVTETAYGILNYYYNLSKEGKINEEDAKKSAMAAINTLRYEDKEYFWINDTSLPFPKMIMHPTVSELNGKVLDAEKFNCATSMQSGIDGDIIKIDGKKNLFQAFVEVADQKGQGYVTYNWPKPLQNGGATKETYPKLSFVKKFEPWQWVIGSGIYIDDLNAAYLKQIKTFILIIAILLTVIALMSFVITRGIIRPVHRLVDQVNMIAEGDLTVKTEHKSKDEIGRLSESMDKMTSKLSVMISKILSSSEDMIKAVESLKTNANKTHEGAKSQSGQAHQIATAAEEMSQTITDIAKNASIAAETSEEAMKIAFAGKNVAEDAVTTVNGVYSSTVELATMVERLNNKASEIGDIVTLIKDIADQTNLLALNAAIEAARAGEQGRGFAVVADEVRKLAERTIKATAEISGKISTIQQESLQTANTMTEASGEVTKATECIRRLGESLNHIVEAVQKVKDQITQIATAVDEQSAASEEMTRNIEKTSVISIEIEKMADDVIGEVKLLTKIAEELKNSAAGFKTKEK